MVWTEVWSWRACWCFWNAAFQEGKWRRGLRQGCLGNKQKFWGSSGRDQRLIVFQPFLSIQSPLNQKSYFCTTLSTTLLSYIQEFEKEKKVGSMGRGDAEGTVMEREDNFWDNRERWGWAAMERARQMVEHVENQGLWERELGPLGQEAASSAEESAALPRWLVLV